MRYMSFVAFLAFLACVMFGHIRSTEVCKDTLPNCSVEDGDCIHRTDYPIQCKKTCGICDVEESDVCEDTYAHCDMFYACGYYGKLWCKETCGLC